MLRSAVGELYKEGVRDADSSEELSEVESEYTSTPNLGILPRAQSHQFQGGGEFSTIRATSTNQRESGRRNSDLLRLTPTVDLRGKAKDALSYGRNKWEIRVPCEGKPKRKL